MTVLWFAWQWFVVICLFVLTWHFAKMRRQWSAERQAHAAYVGSLSRLVKALMEQGTFVCSACGEELPTHARPGGVIVRKNHATGDVQILHGLCAPPLVGAEDVYL